MIRSHLLQTARHLQISTFGKCGWYHQPFFSQASNLSHLRYHQHRRDSHTRQILLRNWGSITNQNRNYVLPSQPFYQFNSKSQSINTNRTNTNWKGEIVWELQENIANYHNNRNKNHDQFEWKNIDINDSTYTATDPQIGNYTCNNLLNCDVKDQSRKSHQNGKIDQFEKINCNVINCDSHDHAQNINVNNRNSLNDELFFKQKNEKLFDMNDLFTYVSIDRRDLNQCSKERIATTLVSALNDLINESTDHQTKTYLQNQGIIKWKLIPGTYLFALPKYKNSTDMHTITMEQELEDRHTLLINGQFVELMAKIKFQQEKINSFDMNKNNSNNDNSTKHTLVRKIQKIAVPQKLL